VQKQNNNYDDSRLKIDVENTAKNTATMVKLVIDSTSSPLYEDCYSLFCIFDL